MLEPVARRAREPPEGVAVEVDEARVCDHEPLPERAERIAAIESQRFIPTGHDGDRSQAEPPVPT